MKNLIFYLMIGVVTVTTLFSCNNTVEFTPDEQQVEITREDDLIERNILNLSTDDASKLAKRFAKNEYDGKSRTASTITVKDIQAVTSETGTPLMYVVNYADNKGYTIISASKNYTPVLVYSDEGYMNVQSSNFMENPFINEYRYRINSVANEENDSLRQRYAIDWSVYEKAPTMVESRAYSDAEIQQKLAEARTYYSSQGYEVHSLGAATSLIPAAGGQTAEQRANGFINDICEHTPSEYDCMDVTLLLVKRTNEQMGPYLCTIWHQNEPYCADAEYGIAGCSSIAVAQIMYHYRWPETFEWNNIDHQWLKTLDELSSDERFFMNSVIEAIDPVYEEKDEEIYTSVIPEKVVAALRSFDYNVTEMAYSRSGAEWYIRQGTPFICYGQNITDSDMNHYWICDGYKANKVQYAAYMINEDFDDYMFFSGMTDVLSEYFHLNMGDGEMPNTAWFYQDNAVYDGANYISNRKMFILSKNE